MVLVFIGSMEGGVREKESIKWDLGKWVAGDKKEREGEGQIGVAMKAESLREDEQTIAAISASN
ncbi:conserved hypothetical protein [Ricinus communis]|uniref:Uncharacterized protein n=1 Tax=Ricinus communis TaxID=3988 RepID=B9RH30_RICCO|nr:conserved hypothetical protein [Ricinus communis]